MRYNEDQSGFKVTLWWFWLTLQRILGNGQQISIGNHFLCLFLLFHLVVVLLINYTRDKIIYKEVQET